MSMGLRFEWFIDFGVVPEVLVFLIFSYLGEVLKLIEPFGRV